MKNLLLLMVAVAVGRGLQASAALAADLIAIGSNESRAETPTETAVETPVPTPSPTVIPIPSLVIDPGPLTPGEHFTVSISLIQDITQPFDFYILVETEFGVYTIYFDGSVKKGIAPLFRNVPQFIAPFFKRIYPAVRVPASLGTVTFYTAVVEAGRIPPITTLSDLMPDTPYVIMMDRQL